MQEVCHLINSMRQQSRFPKVQLPQWGSMIMSILKSALFNSLNENKNGKVVVELEDDGKTFTTSKTPLCTEPQIKLMKSSAACYCLRLYSGPKIVNAMCACVCMRLCMHLSSWQMVILLTTALLLILCETKLDEQMSMKYFCHSVSKYKHKMGINSLNLELNCLSNLYIICILCVPALRHGANKNVFLHWKDQQFTLDWSCDKERYTTGVVWKNSEKRFHFSSK